MDFARNFEQNLQLGEREQPRPDKASLGGDLDDLDSLYQEKKAKKQQVKPQQQS